MFNYNLTLTYQSPKWPEAYSCFNGAGSNLFCLQSTISYNKTLIFFNKFKGKLSHRDSGKMSFETEFLYVIAEWNNKHD